MILSIYFSGKGKDDYINNRTYREVPKKGISQDEFDEIAERTHCRGFEYDRVSRTVFAGYENPLLRKALRDKTVSFAQDKVNVLFGPNGCGKTTIIKTIANHCLCGDEDSNDGFTNLMKHRPGFSFDEYRDYDALLKEQIESSSGNQAEISWDGGPVFYENLTQRDKRSRGVFGALVGGLIESPAEELLWHFDGNKISAGQKTLYLIRKINSILGKIPRPEELIEANRNKHKRANSLWQGILDAQLKYYKSFYKGYSEVKPTILLDEIDRSLDLLNVLVLYTELLPKIVSDGCQIILVSHSPLMITKKIMESEYYNVISLDDKYTKACIKLNEKII